MPAEVREGLGVPPGSPKGVVSPGRKSRRCRDGPREVREGSGGFPELLEGSRGVEKAPRMFRESREGPPEVRDGSGGPPEIREGLRVPAGSPGGVEMDPVKSGRGREGSRNS